MLVIDKPLNSELETILNDFSDRFFKKNLFNVKINGSPDTNEYYTSIEYLSSINKTKHIGYPEVCYGVDLTQTNSTSIDFRDELLKLDRGLNAYFNSKFCAVKMYYPENGYMGWHDNHNCPGYNILVSYNRTGQGFFRYIDPVSNEVITLNDVCGWNAKIGYFGSETEYDKRIWHCARAYSPRLTLGFVIPDKEMWEMMVDDL